jgi:anthranilate 1,2-dioxygenase small subunit
MKADVHAAICRVQADYARCIDDGQLEKWPDFFEADCFYKVTSADSWREGLEAGMIFADSRAMLQDRVTALREANIYERHSYRHILGYPAVLEQDESVVRSETPFLVVRIMRTGESDVFSSGRYIDRYTLHHDEPKLSERIVVCDSNRIDTLLAIPL